MSNKGQMRDGVSPGFYKLIRANKLYVGDRHLSPSQGPEYVNIASALNFPATKDKTQRYPCMQRLTKIILTTVCMMGLSMLHAENSDNSAAAKDALLQQMDEERLAYHGMDAALAVTEDEQLKAIYQR